MRDRHRDYITVLRHLSIPLGNWGREQAAGLWNAGRPDAGWGHSPMGNNKHMYAYNKATGMLIVAKAALS